MNARDNIMPDAQQKINLLGMQHKQLQDFFVSQGEKPFRATQVLKGIHQRGLQDLSDITDISKKLCAHLQSFCVIAAPEIVSENISRDGTYKWLMRTASGGLVETVFIPQGHRGTLCISSQVGCALNCSFCSTGKQGFQSNLSSAEIIGQLWQAKKRLSAKITNVVMMGMGEPLLNFAALVPALDIMRDDNAYGLAKKRVTVSTSGVVPMIDKLGEVADVSLAVSLHAPYDELRNKLVPLNKKYNIACLMDACKRYTKQHKRIKITMEYVMLKGVNDDIKHAKQLVKILNGVPCKVNLIPFNSFPGTTYERSSALQIEKFSKILSSSGIISTTRLTRGDDITAACGQLVGVVYDKTKRSQRIRDSTGISE